MEIDYNKPEAWQVEVVVLGPGYGESIVVHLGDDRWMIVDSCIKSKGNIPSAAEYLKAIGVNLAEQVELIVATHWHDDHIRGISDLVDECVNARFSCSTAFSNDEFKTFIARYNERNVHQGGSGVKELFQIYSILNQRAGSSKPPMLAIENRRLLSADGSAMSHGNNVSVWSLSPSDEQVHQFLDEVGKMIPTPRTTIKRAAPFGQNHSALVNLIEIGNFGILLGSDLENVASNNSGWKRVVSTSNENNYNKSYIFKIPHHGSMNAFNSDVWADILVLDPFALMTPWNRSSGLPKQEGIDAIKSKTTNGYITSSPGSKSSSVKRSPAVERTIKETLGGKLRQVSPEFGIIQLRALDNQLSNWDVNLSSRAFQL